MKSFPTHKGSLCIPHSWENGCYPAGFGKQVTASTTSERKKVLRPTPDDLQLLKIQEVKIIQESRVKKGG